MKCSIIQDLLPNYIDDLTSEETKTEIEKHLKECEDCQKIYKDMSANVPKLIETEEKEIDVFKKVKKKLKIRNIIITAFICILIFFGFYIFANNYKLPLPFDANRMFIEPFEAAVVTLEDGEIGWLDINGNLYENYVSDISSETLDLIQISYKGINHISGSVEGRNIKQDGEEVRVVYYCYYKTLWDSLTYDTDLSVESEGGSMYSSDIYGDTFQSKDYKPQKRQIYYLPMKNIHKIEKLSDEEFAKLKEKAYLIWEGIV